MLDNKHRISSEDLVENLFGSEMVMLCSSQRLIICNGLMKWTNSSRMNCIHGLGRSVIDYVIVDILYTMK